MIMRLRLKPAKKAVSLHKPLAQDDKYYAGSNRSVENENCISGAQPSLLKIHHPLFRVMR